MRREGDSIGGIAEIVATGVPAGWGEPVFDKLKADLGKAMLSLPAVMGVEYGAGFAVAAMKGSEANDPIEMRDGRVATRGPTATGACWAESRRECPSCCAAR